MLRLTVAFGAGMKNALPRQGFNCSGKNYKAQISSPYSAFAVTNNQYPLTNVWMNRAFGNALWRSMKENVSVCNN